MRPAAELAAKLAARPRGRLALRRAGVAACVLILALGAERGLDCAWPYPVKDLRTVATSRVFHAVDGSVLRVTPTPDGERCLRVALVDVSSHVVDALISAEDRRFRSHSGVDPLAIVRAAAGNAISGRVVSGASTVTMQLARLVEPRPRNLVSKIREAFRARQLERRFSKDEILEAYLNRVPFGGTTRGIEAAALRWYGKRARDLDLAEAAALIAMLPAPSSRAPDLGGAERLADARHEVLARMERQGVIDGEARATAALAPLPTRRVGWPYRAPHACDAAALRDTSPVVVTSIDLDLQTRVEEVARAHEGAGTDGLAVVVLDRTSGAVRALLGSRNYRQDPLNTALCRRSAGSTLKPFLYALAWELGAAGPDALVHDTPVIFSDYAPRNFEGEYHGAVTAAHALATSRNLPAVRLLRTVGPERFADLLRTLGLRLPDHALHVDAALGTMSVSPLELARAYQRFAGPSELSGLSRRVRDQVVSTLARTPPDAARLAPGTVAWKTGTSSGRRDAWCAGVTSEHVIVVWLGQLGGEAAADLVGGRSAADLLAALVVAL